MKYNNCILHELGMNSCTANPYKSNYFALFKNSVR